MTYEICKKNIRDNKQLWERHCVAIKTACDNFLGWNSDFLPEEYINEKLDGMKDINRRLTQLYKEREIYTKEAI